MRPLLTPSSRQCSVWRKVKYIFLAFCLIEHALAASYSRSLTEILKEYDTLKKENLAHRIVKRSIGEGGVSYGKEIHFESLGRKFDLQLVPDHSIFSPDFHAVIQRDDEEIELPLDKDSFMSGYVEGASNSKVVAHMEDGILTASIEMIDDSYIVESSSRHVEGDHGFDMIVYRLSDVRANLSNPHTHSSGKKPSFCGVKNYGNVINDVYEKVPHKHRERRATPSSAIETYDTCPLALVADYLFFEHMGQGKSSTAINYILSVIQRVDQIYRSVSWPSGLKNIGFEVRRVILHDKPSDKSGPEYNRIQSKAWSEEDLLTAFSKGTWKDNDICLGHLFTYQDFPNGVIGVAYVGNAKKDSVGGICSVTYKNSRGQAVYTSSGLSSSMNWGRRLLTSEADVVTAHELGHNFGSNHDPYTKECSPSESGGGKFMMYATSVSGLKPNNKKFSPCSIRSIDEVLTSKRQSCFKSKVGQYCGNNEVEKNAKDPSKSEECDPGLDAKLNSSLTDKCCDNNCKFKTGASCSDTNMPCCENCQPAKKTKKCREKFAAACQAATYCDGVSAKCPDAPPLSGEPCALSYGMCYKGVCKTICQQRNKVDCICSKAADTCRICCATPNVTDTCRPIIVNSTTLNVNDGGPCDTGSFTGTCQSGTCKKTQKNVFDHFLNLLNDFTASKFAQFMQENIVGTIIIFSLLLWLPASCIVHVVDRRREKEAQEKLDWESIHSTDLLRPWKDKNKKGRQGPRKERRIFTPSRLVAE